MDLFVYGTWMISNVRSRSAAIYSSIIAAFSQAFLILMMQNWKSLIAGKKWWGTFVSHWSSYIVNFAWSINLNFSFSNFYSSNASDKFGVYEFKTYLAEQATCFQWCFTVTNQVCLVQFQAFLKKISLRMICDFMESDLEYKASKIYIIIFICACLLRFLGFFIFCSSMGWCCML